MFASLAAIVCSLLLTTSAQNIGRFWHMTDFHYDNTYFTEQLSCNDDVPNPGPFGDYWCDSPWALVQSAVDFMAETSRGTEVDFAIWTGDTIAHISDDDTSVALNEIILQNVTSALEAGLSGIPVYASLGNHDFYPNGQTTGERDEIYIGVGKMWESWISNQAQVQRFEEGGFYSTPIRNAPNLVLLALNTNFYYTSNKQTAEIADPAGQFVWMRAQLERAKTAGKKVLITGHVPAGLMTPELVDWFYPHHKESFVKILFDYADVIAATHFGHDHHDGFKILQNSDGSQAVSQFTAPSVTPWRYRFNNPVTGREQIGKPHNPGVRLVEYDRDTGAHLNYHQYYINLTDTNTRNQANWGKLYSFQDAYDVPDMSVASLRAILERLKDGEGEKYSTQFCHFSLVSAYEKACEDQARGEIYCGGHIYDKEQAVSCVEEYLKRINGARSMTAGFGLLQLVLTLLAGLPRNI